MNTLQNVQKMLDYLADFTEQMSRREAEFIEDMIDSFERGDKSITERQYQWLIDINDSF